MPEFIRFRDAVESQLATLLQSDSVYRVAQNNVTHSLSEIYLSAIPERINPIFRERSVYNCNCCIRFIKDVGDIVTINANGTFNTIWDIEIGGDFQAVADKLALELNNSVVVSQFLIDKGDVGTEHNVVLLDGDLTTTRFEHFHGKVPSKFVVDVADVSPTLNKIKETHQMFLRALTEISLHSVDTVLELLGNSLAECQIDRGFPFKEKLTQFKKHLLVFPSETEEQSLYVWQNIDVGEHISRIRNSVIGTLLVDITEGVDLNVAIEKYEFKVDPTRMNRSSSAITPSMKKRADKFAIDHGIVDSCPRRYAEFNDIHITNVIYANEAVKKAKSLFDQVPVEPQTHINKGQIQTLALADFIEEILPTTTKLEVFFEPELSNKLVSLITPLNTSSKPILKWNNNFSWSYRGGVTDSLKQRVSTKGGRTDGDLRISLEWYNSDDLDLHLFTANNTHVYHADRKPIGLGLELDVDMNVSVRGEETRLFSATSPIENISCVKASDIPKGKNRVQVCQFLQRNTKNYGFSVELEFKGVVTTFNAPNKLQQNQVVPVFDFEYDISTDKLIITNAIDSVKQQGKFWGIASGEFHEVNMVTYSPNYWDNQEVGNKHIFFLMEDCINLEGTRGLYNEFLSKEFHPHRKTFEALGDVLQVPPSTTTDQLSGLGFAVGNRASITCQVTSNGTKRKYLVNI